MNRVLSTVFACLVGGPSIADVQTLYQDAHFPEGALVSNGESYFVELIGDRFVHLSDGGPVTFWDGNGCHPASAIDFEGGFLVACHESNAIVRLDGKGQEIDRYVEDANGVTFNDPNDFTYDGKGGVWFTTSGPADPALQPAGQVFHLSAGGERLVLAAEGLSYGNGLAVTPDGTALLVADMFNSRILSYPIDGTSLGQPAIWSDLNDVSPNAKGGLPTYPDGMEYGPDGLLHVAIWGGSRIIVLTADGGLARTIQTPLLGTTNLAFQETGDILVTGVTDISGPPFPGEVVVISAP